MKNYKDEISPLRYRFGRNDYIITRLGGNRHRRSPKTHLLARYSVATAPYDRSGEV